MVRHAITQHRINPVSSFPQLPDAACGLANTVIAQLKRGHWFDPQKL